MFPRGAARGSEIPHHHQILTNALHLAATDHVNTVPAPSIMASLSNRE